MYGQADFESANLLLSSILWDSLLSDSDVNNSWSIFKEVFLNIMSITIPTKASYPTTHSPWINKAFLSKVKKCNHLFARAKCTGSTSLWFAYRKQCSNTLSLLRHLKKQFFDRLSLSPSLRFFWSFVKKLTQKQNQILTLHHNDVSASTSDAKANLLNNFFAQSFNPCISSPSCLSHSFTFSDHPPDLLRTSYILFINYQQTRHVAPMVFLLKC